jgi:hypothetical protein
VDFLDIFLRGKIEDFGRKKGCPCSVDDDSSERDENHRENVMKQGSIRNEIVRQ